MNRVKVAVVCGRHMKDIFLMISYWRVYGSSIALIWNDLICSHLSMTVCVCVYACVRVCVCVCVCI